MIKISALLALVAAEGVFATSYAIPSKIARGLDLLKHSSNQEHRRELLEEITETCAQALYDLEDIEALDAAEDLKEEEFEALVYNTPEEVCSVNIDDVLVITCDYDLCKFILVFFFWVTLHLASFPHDAGIPFPSNLTQTNSNSFIDKS